MPSQAVLDRLNGVHEGDILKCARDWVRAIRYDPPASGSFLADDLERMADEIERLRAWQRARLESHDAMQAEIERLRAELDGSKILADLRQNGLNKSQMLLHQAKEIVGLRAALKPFAAIPIWRDAYPDGPDVISVGSERHPFTIGDVHAARNALEQNGKKT